MVMWSQCWTGIVLPGYLFISTHLALCHWQWAYIRYKYKGLNPGPPTREASTIPLGYRGGVGECERVLISCRFIQYYLKLTFPPFESWPVMFKASKSVLFGNISASWLSHLPLIIAGEMIIMITMLDRYCISWLYFYFHTSSTLPLTVNLCKV